MINLAQKENPLYCPKCGEKAFSPVDRKSLQCGRCHFHYFHNNAAAVAAVIRVDNEVLFTVRNREPHTGLLDLPGGFVDPGEGIEAALVREIREELGLEVDGLRYLFSFPNTGYRYKEVLYTTADAFFEIRLPHPPALSIQEDEVGQVRWLKLPEVRDEDIAFESIRSAVAALR